MALNGAPILLFFSITLFLFTASNAKTLCQRIYFQNIAQDQIPYKMIEGVYVMQRSRHNSFPVYKKENDNLLFYLNTTAKGERKLIFGLSFNSFFGLGSYLLSSPGHSIWLANGILNRTDVFEGLILSWFYQIPRYYNIHNMAKTAPIKAICVEDDFRECNSGRVYINTNLYDSKGMISSNASSDYFERQTGTFRNLRSVYKHSSQSWYLQYTSDNYWVVTSTRYPSSYNGSGALMRVDDFALRPEYISNIWSVFTGNRWEKRSSIEIKCRGIRSQVNTCSSYPCSWGDCVYTSSNETLCVCRPGYYGLWCTKRKKCSEPQKYLDSEKGFLYTGTLPGSIAMTFCLFPNPLVRYAICNYRHDYPYWLREGATCQTRPSSTTILPETPQKPTQAGILVGAIILQILFPFVLWCFVCCKRFCEEPQKHIEQFSTDLEARLESVEQAQNHTELDQGVRSCRRAVQSYPKEMKRLRKKRVYGNLSRIVRLTSMSLYFSFYLWLIYYIACTASEWTKHGAVFGHLKTLSIVMLIICAIVVLFESNFSRELSYIKNIMDEKTAWSYIQRMQKVAPVAAMTVKCYQWKPCSGKNLPPFVTSIDKQDFQHGRWNDVSKREKPTINNDSLTRIKIDDHIWFGDQETEDDFVRQRQGILDRHQDEDGHIGFKFTKSIPVFEKRICVYADLSVKPWWIEQWFFWLATLLMLTWPYRWFFKRKTAKIRYGLQKIIYKSPTPPVAPAGRQQVRVEPAVAHSDIINACVNPQSGNPSLPATAPPPYEEIWSQNTR